jgi:hypothetical protein
MKYTESLVSVDHASSNAHTPSQFVDHSCCCCHIAYFPVGRVWMLGHWIINLIKPILISLGFLVLSAIAVLSLSYCPFHDHHLPIAVDYSVFALFAFCALNSAISYFAVIIRGPGYLPFNYSVFRIIASRQTWNEQMSTIVTYREQGEYAKRSDRPPRACFSVRARRFILRGDHYCLWTESWIGLNNHRYFLLMTFWVTLYCLVWLGMQVPFALTFLPFRWVKLIVLIGGAVILGLTAFSMFYFVTAFVNLVKNRTLIEFWSKTASGKYDRGCCQNFADVCGQKSCCCLWPCPLACLEPLWDGIDPEIMRTGWEKDPVKKSVPTEEQFA